MAWTHSLAGPAADASGVPEVWFQHTPPRLTGRLDWHAALSSTALIFANSIYTAKCQQRLNLRRFPVSVVSPPVEPSSVRENRTVVRDELGVGHDVVLAMLPGRLQRTKGQDIAIRAFAVASRKTPQLRLAIVGDEAFGLDKGYGAELRALTRDLGVGEEVVFTGHQSNIQNLLSASDIVLCPSLKPEGYGLVVAEALAAGKPVVATNLGATPELVSDGTNGILIPPNDVDLLADVLTELAANPQKREKLGAAALASELTDAKTGARQLQTVYMQLLDT
jgi:glycosyltransferase involved in cell wall biosynthesis